MNKSMKNLMATAMLQAKVDPLLSVEVLNQLDKLAAEGKGNLETYLVVICCSADDMQAIEFDKPLYQLQYRFQEEDLAKEFMEQIPDWDGLWEAPVSCFIIKEVVHAAMPFRIPLQQYKKP